MLRWVSSLTLLPLEYSCTPNLKCYQGWVTRFVSQKNEIEKTPSGGLCKNIFLSQFFVQLEIICTMLPPLFVCLFYHNQQSKVMLLFLQNCVKSWRNSCTRREAISGCSERWLTRWWQSKENFGHYNTPCINRYNFFGIVIKSVNGCIKMFGEGTNIKLQNPTPGSPNVQASVDVISWWLI